MKAFGCDSGIEPWGVQSRTSSEKLVPGPVLSPVLKGELLLCQDDTGVPFKGQVIRVGVRSVRAGAEGVWVQTDLQAAAEKGWVWSVMCRRFLDKVNS